MNVEDRPLENSRFLHLIDDRRTPRTYCLFHSLTQHKLYGGEILESAYNEFQRPTLVPDALARLLAKYPRTAVEEVLGDLEEKGLIVPNKDTDLTSYLQFFHRGLELYKIRHAYFIAAADCNLRCAYCFVEEENRGYPAGRMTLATARRSLEVFAKLTEEVDKITLTFYGGEPLLNSSVVYDSMRYVRELEKRKKFKCPVDMTLLTNGVLVDKNTLRAVMETRTNVSISIDGPIDLHDKGRVDIAKKGTFERAIRGFRLLQRAGVNPGVSCTLTRHNVQHIERLVKFVATKLKPAGMGFNVLLPTIGSGNPLDVDHQYVTDQLIVAFRLLREYGIYEDRVMRRVTPFKDGFFHFKDCMGVGGQIVITPKGRIGPCQAFLGLDKYFPLSVEELHSRLTAIDSDELYGQALFEEWRHRFPLNMKDCADCEAIAVCGGGCPYASLVNHGSIWKVDERICFQAKGILNWMIWDALGHMVRQRVT